MSYDDKEYRKYTRKSETDKAMHTLEGILKGINIDHVINMKEINSLKRWCDEKYQFIASPPFSQVIPFIMKISEDNKITEEEYEDLKWLCQNFSTDSLYYNAIASDMQRLFGIIHGIISDNVINEDELYELREWMNDHSDLIGIYPYDEIESYLYKVLEDGDVSEDEQNELKVYFSQFVDISTTEIDRKEL
jgi:hypothetical protein